MDREMIIHPFEPFVRPDSEILILGSFPSRASREQGFYYGHPRNRFWTVLARVSGEETPRTIEQKTAFLTRHRIALWDVISSCEIRGSSDASVRNAVPADISGLLASAPIRKIYCNGALAGRLFLRYQTKPDMPEMTVIPSTSPANASFSVQRLIQCWNIILG